jgi:tRNA threonylcarbamoyladenosine biosynthesis protein TsaB
MLDARRMEVYSAIFNANLENRETLAEVITEHSFEEMQIRLFCEVTVLIKCKSVY